MRVLACSTGIITFDTHKKHIYGPCNPIYCLCVGPDHPDHLPYHPDSKPFINIAFVRSFLGLILPPTIGGGNAVKSVCNLLIFFRFVRV